LFFILPPSRLSENHIAIRLGRMQQTS
jgi:hypothetical protein